MSQDRALQLVRWINSLLLIARFVSGGAGSQHGVGPLRRLAMALRFRRNARRIESFSTWRQHLLMAETLLRLPKEIEGDVVECGCFNGGSTANLSIACSAAGRKLWVCDSFEGLSAPEPDEEEEAVFNLSGVVSYQAGDLASEGGVEGVRETIRRYGEPDCCELVEGYFADTLPDLATQSVVMVFEDADLRSSVEDCVLHLWPKLREGCRFYCHEPHSPQVVALFYDRAWWRENLGAPPPGFFGSGAGIVEVMLPSLLGFAVKFDAERAKRQRAWTRKHKPRSDRASDPFGAVG